MRTQTQTAIKRHTPRTEMSRAERRRLERDSSKSQKTHTLTQAQIDQMKKEVSMEATKKAFLMMMGFPLLTLRDVDLADLDRTIMEETGVTLIRKREGKH